MEWCDPKMIWFLFGAVCVLGGCALIAFMYRESARISRVSISRSGAEIDTCDRSIAAEIRMTIDQIDASARKSIRKSTVGLMILDPDKYDMSTESLLAVQAANLPLIYASYENHHTRALDSEGAGVYISDKSSDVLQAVSPFRRHFPELTNEAIDSYVHRWIKNILIPMQLQACRAKVDFYQSMNKRKDVSKAIKEENNYCIEKNVRYIGNFNELSELSDIRNRTAIFNQKEMP